MKKKFEDNVASQIPRTKSEEPSLPWKIDEADLAKADSESREYKDLAQGAPPLKTRPAFLIALVIAVFAAAIFMIASVTTENDKIKVDISEKEKEAATLQVDLDKAGAEKTALENSAAQLEKRVNDLSAQKELFTAVLESLTRKESPAPAEGPASEVPPPEKKENF